MSIKINNGFEKNTEELKKVDKTGMGIRYKK